MTSRVGLRHKEATGTVERGMTVIGAGGTGPLRAAEIGLFEMIGSGRVFEWYRDMISTGGAAVPRPAPRPVIWPTVIWPTVVG
ncbi:TfuA-like protein [Saccharothrix coeruleofusca]|uniref:TfuA-like protein n=1 Tax=Saccharothrix coeruleofusca TaxID=33919 RepID=UPI00227D7336|nr:TfuA-like protein [Saccharothrix coeruleofusca]